MSVTARARVVVQIEVCPPDVWEGQCTVDQLIAQARGAAVGIVTRALAGNPRLTLVGTPTVTVVEAKEAR